MAVRFKAFKTGIWGDWRAAMEEAAAFASTVGEDRVISISHSHNHTVHIITVWYWV